MGGNYLMLGVDKTLLNLEPIFFLKNFKRDLNNVNGIKFQYLGKDYLLAARPRIVDFLNEVSKDFILVAYSDMPKHITKAKLKMLNLNKYFKYVLGNECLVKNKKSIVKAAECLNVDPKEIIVIDNSSVNCIDKDFFKIKPFLIGRDVDYESEDHDDNLFGILRILNLSKVVVR